MGCLAPAVAAASIPPSLIYASKKKWNSGLRATNLNGEDDPSLKTAINGAFLRFQENHQPSEMERWREEFQRMEEEGDEDSFEEL